MSDRYASFAHSKPGRLLVRRLGLPDPPRLRRYRPGDPAIAGPVLLGGAGRLVKPARDIIETAGAAITLADAPVPEMPDGTASAVPRDQAALVYDASAIKESTGLRDLYEFLHRYARSLRPCGRVVVLGTPPAACASPPEAIAQRALVGLVRTVGREFGRGSTAQLVYVSPGGEEGIESTLRFLLSARSAYVSGQVIEVGPAPATRPADWDRPLADRVALVTGAARGIGEATARVLTRDGAQVICLDIPSAGDALSTVVNDLKAAALQLDITTPQAPARLVEYLVARYGRLDILVHNAGITRDKTLARMSVDQWDAVLAVNLVSQERLTAALLDRRLMPPGGRIVSVSSVSAIAGNRGQANYATSKAGVIGFVESMAPLLAEQGITVNAVAPGFIETAMTARIPMVVREAGRRMNSMAQGGLPVDVAETIAWLASPGSAGITGSVVRVCGQSLLGA